MNINELNKMKVTGIGGLREFVVKNKIFKGISNLKKNEFIEKIINSEWYKINGVKEENKVNIIDEKNNIKNILLEKQRLRDEIKKLDKLIKNTNKTIDKDIINTDKDNIIIKSIENDKLDEINEIVKNDENNKLDEINEIDELDENKNIIKLNCKHCKKIIYMKNCDD